MVKKGVPTRARRSTSGSLARRPAAATAGVVARPKPAAAIASSVRPAGGDKRGRSPPPRRSDPDDEGDAAKGPGGRHSPRGPRGHSPSSREEDTRPTIFYNATMDPENFEKMIPRKGERITIVLGDDPAEFGKVDVEMVHVEPSDSDGAIGVVRYLGTGDAHLHEWGSDNLTGMDKEVAAIVHFCRRKKCDVTSERQELLHIPTWKFLALPSGPHGEERAASSASAGVPLVGGARDTAWRDGRMGQVDRVREVMQGAMRGGAASSVKPAFPPPHPGLKGINPDERRRVRFPGLDSIRSGRRDEDLTGDRRREALPPDLAGKGKKMNVTEILNERAKRDIEEAGRRQSEAKKSRRNGDSGRDRRRRRSSSSSRSGSPQVFREGPSIFRNSLIVREADLREGELLKNGVSLMTKALAARPGGTDIRLDDEQGGIPMSVVTTYLTTALAPSLMSQGKTMNVRNERELRTLSEAMDSILRGKVAHAGDILMQRFRACEMSLMESSWEAAQQLELIPPSQVSCIPPGMRQNVQRETLKLRKLHNPR